MKKLKYHSWFRYRSPWHVWEKVEDAIGISHKSKTDRQYNSQDQKGQKDKQLSTKRYSENKRLSNTDPTKTGGVPICLKKKIKYSTLSNGCSFFLNSCDKSWQRKWLDCDYDWWIVFVGTCVNLTTRTHWFYIFLVSSNSLSTI
jgi:hypothetical protein